MGSMYAAPVHATVLGAEVRTRWTSLCTYDVLKRTPQGRPMSTNDPYSQPQYPPAGGKHVGQPQHPPAYGGQQGYRQPQGYGPEGSSQQGYAAGSSGQGYQQQQGYGPGPQGYPQQQGYYQPGPGAYQQHLQRPGSQPGVPVSFGEAVKRFYSKYAQFSGRASRSEYWWVALYFGLIYFTLSLLAAADTNSFGETGALGTMMNGLLVIFTLGNLVPSVAVGVRRLHDVNMSGWFMLLGLIPYLGGLVLLVFTVLPPKPEGARFDR